MLLDKQRARFTVLLIIATIIMALAATGVAHAQDEIPTPAPPEPAQVTEDQVNEIAGELYCPVCENVPLDVCGTQACADWRQEIRDMLSDGESEQAIKDYFSNRYGRRVLANPDAQGFYGLIYILPVAALVAGSGVLVVAVRRMVPLDDTLAPEAALAYDGLDPAYVERVHREIQELSE